MGLGVGGLMSGLDTGSIISQLMQVERRPIQMLQVKEAGIQGQISALGSLKSALSSLQSAAAALNDTDAFKTHTASSSDTDFVTVSSTTTTLNAGEYNIWVEQLAQAEHAYSAGVADSDTTELGAGTITIQLGTGTAVDIDIDTDNSTLEGIAKAINDSDAEVTATVVNDGAGVYKLMVVGDKSGAANTIDFTIVSADGLDANLGAFPPTQTAASAVLWWDTASDATGGTQVTRSSNTIDDLIEGTTLTLKQAQGDHPGVDPLTGTPVIVTLTHDPASTATKVEKFVTEYNKVVATLDQLQFYNSDTGQSGALQGDSLVRRVEARLRDFLTTEVDGVASDVNGLSNLGVEVDADGKLTFDKSVFLDALKDHPTDVVKFFTQETAGKEGLAIQIDELLDGYLDTDGLIAAREDGLQSRIERIGEQVERIELRLAKREETLQRQFAALEMLMAQFQATSSSLDQQLQSISNLNTTISKRR